MKVGIYYNPKIDLMLEISHKFTLFGYSIYIAYTHNQPFFYRNMPISDRLFYFKEDFKGFDYICDI